MNFHKFIFSTSLIFTCTSSYALQDFTVANNSDTDVTAKTSWSVCSGSIGEKGVIKAHQPPVVIPSSVQSTYCYFGCDIDVYASKNCNKSTLIITAHIDSKHGISHVVNHSPYYHLGGSEYSVSLEGKKPGIKGWFERLFG